MSKPSILLTLTKLQHASAKMPITISLRRRKGQGQPRLVRTSRTSFVCGESPGRLIRYSLMFTVVPQRLNGRCLNQKPRNILSAEWIGLSSTRGQSNSAKFAPIWPRSTRSHHARNCGILTMRGEDTQYELLVSRRRLLQRGCHTMGHRVRRRQSDAHGPLLSSGLGPGRCNTDFVSVISAIVTPVSRCSLAAVPLTIKA